MRRNCIPEATLRELYNKNWPNSSILRNIDRGEQNKFHLSNSHLICKSFNSRLAQTRIVYTSMWRLIGRSGQHSSQLPSRPHLLLSLPLFLPFLHLDLGVQSQSCRSCAQLNKKGSQRICTGFKNQMYVCTTFMMWACRCCHCQIPRRRIYNCICPLIENANNKSDGQLRQAERSPL